MRALTEAILAEVTCLPIEGINWVKKNTVFHEVVELFKYLGEKLVWKGTGICPISLSKPWRELEKVFQKYITCDDHHDVVRPRHLKLLATLKKKIVINLPFFLNMLLHEVACSVRKSRNTQAIVIHHGLIKLVVIKKLT